MTIRYYDNPETGLAGTAEVTSVVEKNLCVKANSNNWFLQVLCQINEECPEFLSDDELIHWYADCM